MKLMREPLIGLRGMGIFMALIEVSIFSSFFFLTLFGCYTLIGQEEVLAPVEHCFSFDFGHWWLLMGLFLLCSRVQYLSSVPVYLQ
jgi:hypothetical protein